jgi:hypothetical protein
MLTNEYICTKSWERENQNKNKTSKTTIPTTATPTT